MSKAKGERSPLYPKILFGFTDHPITVWAGVILLRVYFEWIKLREELGVGLVGLTKRSNNQISVVDVMLGWFYGLALGAERFEHLTRYRRDRLLGELLGMKRFASPDTIRRLFLRFNYQKVTEVSERMMRFSLGRMRVILIGHIGFGFYGVLSIRRARREFAGVQSAQARAAVASSVDGVFGRGEKVIVGDVAQWEQWERERVRGVHEAGAERASWGASDRHGTGRCGIFRETILGVFGARGFALYCRG